MTYDMDPKLNRHIFTLIVMILTLDLSIGVQAKTSGKTAKTSDNKKVIQEKKENKRFISIDFNNMDINVFIKFISELTSKSVVVDQRLKGELP